jgi:putative ABC transport system ATP-binding protein
MYDSVVEKIMIQLNNINYTYLNSDFRLTIDSLTIEKGKKTAVIGPSGFGKTTMLNLIAGIIPLENGRINIDNIVVNLLNDKERRDFRIKKIGFVFQDFKLLNYLNVMDNILLPYRINNSLKMGQKSKQVAKSVAVSLGIDSKLSKFPLNLSHGERQRVALCRALLNKPSIILADEPTGNLDPENKNHIMDILFNYVNEYGSTLITVTHDHELLKGFDTIIDFKKLKKT